MTLRSPHFSALPRLTLAGLAALALTGCVSIKIDPLRMASPKPELADIEVCQAVGDAPRRLSKHTEACLAPVEARAWWSVSSVQVAAGKTYRLSLPPGQYWWDASRRSDPAVGDDGSGFMNVMKAYKRLPDHPWFVLTATILNCSAQNFQSAPTPNIMAAQDDCTDTPGLVLGPGPGQLLRADRSGRLAFYANDMAGFYDNNQGQVWVLIERVEP